jgi:hypothetical protein
MKKLALLLALAFAVPAFAEPAMLPSHAVRSLAVGTLLRPEIAIEALAVAATTTYSSNSGQIVFVTADSGSAAAPTTVADGINLEGLYGVNVIVEASGTMTAGGTLQCYVWNPQSTTWVRNPDLDLTVAALQRQAFAGIFVAAARGRATWVPNGVGSLATTVYMVGGVRQP